jgi:hypothetical protein
MWIRLVDELLDHPKVFRAGKRVGKNGAAVTLGFYSICLMWTNRHLTDGFIPRTTVESFRHVDDPLAVADALVHAGLFDKVSGGFQIHDFSDWNPSAKTIKEKRKGDRLRKRAERAENNGRG